jgi:hypothetical protein
VRKAKSASQTRIENFCRQASKAARKMKDSPIEVWRAKPLPGYCNTCTTAGRRESYEKS